MTKINAELIKTLNPCKDRLANYLKFYANKSHTKIQFMRLKNITHEDKLWVAFRLTPRSNIVLAAADIAELVLHKFESKFPHDSRPRKAIEAVKSGNIPEDLAADAYVAARTARIANVASADAYAAAYAAANAANGTSAASIANAANTDYVASYTAYAAAQAAAYAARAAAHAADAAYAANDDMAANVAANTAYAASRTVDNMKSLKKQEKLILKIILKYWKENRK